MWSYKIISTNYEANIKRIPMIVKPLERMTGESMIGYRTGNEDLAIDKKHGSNGNFCISRKNKRNTTKNWFHIQMAIICVMGMGNILVTKAFLPSIDNLLNVRFIHEKRHSVIFTTRCYFNNNILTAVVVKQTLRNKSCSNQKINATLLFQF